MPTSDVIKEYKNDEIETDNTTLSESSSDTESSTKSTQINIPKRQHLESGPSTSNRFAAPSSDNEDMMRTKYDPRSHISQSHN